MKKFLSRINLAGTWLLHLPKIIFSYFHYPRFFLGHEKNTFYKLISRELLLIIILDIILSKSKWDAGQYSFFFLKSIIIILTSVFKRALKNLNNGKPSPFIL